MNRTLSGFQARTQPRFLALLTAACLAALGFGCETTEPLELGTVHLALHDTLLSTADVLRISARQNGAEFAVWSFSAADVPPDEPRPHEAAFDLPIGDYDALVLEGSVLGRPLYLGQSQAFRVEGGAEVSVEIVIDPYGRLRVLPLGLPELLGVSVAARPLAPLPGDPDRYPLIGDGEGFAGDLPIGAYAIEVDVSVLGQYVTADPLEVRVIEGQVVELRAAFGMIIPPLLPQVVDRLELLIGGGGLLGGFSLTVTALDADGRRVPGYDGRITFASLGLDLGLVEVQVPGPYNFVPAEDNGSHTFDAGLLVNLLGLVTVRFEVEVEDDDGLRTTAPACVQGLLGRCP